MSIESANCFRQWAQTQQRSEHHRFTISLKEQLLLKDARGQHLDDLLLKHTVQMIAKEVTL